MQFPDSPLSPKGILSHTFHLLPILIKNAWLFVVLLILTKLAYLFTQVYISDRWLLTLTIIFLDIFALLCFTILIRQAWRAWQGMTLLPLKNFFKPFFSTLLVTILLWLMMMIAYELAVWIGRFFLYVLGENRGKLMAAAVTFIVGFVLVAVLLMFFYVIPAVALNDTSLYQSFHYSWHAAGYNFLKTLLGFIILFLMTLLLTPTTYMLYGHLSVELAVIFDMVMSILIYPLLISYYLVLYRDSQVRYALRYED